MCCGKVCVNGARFFWGETDVVRRTRLRLLESILMTILCLWHIVSDAKFGGSFEIFSGFMSLIYKVSQSI